GWSGALRWPAGGFFASLFFFSSRRRHTRSDRDWSSDVCSSDLAAMYGAAAAPTSQVMAAIGIRNVQPVTAATAAAACGSRARAITRFHPACSTAAAPASRRAETGTSAQALTRPAPPLLRVQRLDLVLVLLVDRLALELHRR